MCWPREFGHIDVHLLQYSGAIWYPMVYDMPARAKESFGTQKRQRQMDRARQYIDQVGATWVVPSAGPPCFLDPALRHLNDDHGDPANIFPDQMVFLDQMRRHGHDGGLLMIPGSVADFTGTAAEFADPPGRRRRGDLHHRQVGLHRRLCRPDGARARRGAGELGRRRRRAAAGAAAGAVRADHAAKRRDLRRHRLPGRTGDRSGDRDSGLSQTRGARTYSDEKVRYGFAIAPELVRTVLRDHEPDWVNTIFLSTRFTAWRVGGYNEYLYTFFKCLTDERIAYADGWFAETHDDSASITHGRLGNSAPLPASQGRPLEIRCGRGRHADLQSARLAMAARRWPLPDHPRSPVAKFAGMSDSYDDGLIQLDRAAITLRRYHFPSGTSKIVALRQSAATKPSRWAGWPLGSASGAVQTHAIGCRWT